MENILIYLIPLFAIVAFLYSSTGLGGASTYLAILALFNVPYTNIPPISLSCNIVVTLGVVYHFYKAGHFKLNIITPFIVTSIPAAFLGGMLKLPEMKFKLILALLLAVVALRIFFWRAKEHETKEPTKFGSFVIGPLAGAVLGLISGMVGVGGGLLLLPVIVFLKWGSAKEAAAAAGLFTLLNSVSGLVAHGMKGEMNWALLLPLLIAVVVGGQIGARLGARKFPVAVVQRIFACILMIVAIRLAGTFLHF